MAISVSVPQCRRDGGRLCFGRLAEAAVEETLRIGREARLPVEIFHLKVSGKQNWGKAAELIKKIEAARAAGLLR